MRCLRNKYKEPLMLQGKAEAMTSAAPDSPIADVKRPRGHAGVQKYWLNKRLDDASESVAIEASLL